MRRLMNKKGVALMAAYVALATLVTLSIGFTRASIDELAQSRRYHDAAKAFWLAEGGVNQFIADTTLLDDGQGGVTCDGSTCTKTITTGNDTIVLSKTDGAVRTITAQATTNNGVARTLEIEFPPTPPGTQYSKTLTTGGNLHFEGYGFQIRIPFFGNIEFPSTLKVWGEVGLTGDYVETGEIKQSWFENPIEDDLNESQTTLVYPDGATDENSQGDEFSDYVDFYRDMVTAYGDEAVYFTPEDGEVLEIWPFGNSEEGWSSLVGKKIVFVEGSSAGQGDVEIYFNSNGWVNNENLTIVSTGTVTYSYPLQILTNSKLNVVTWESYTEDSLFLAKHNGTVYSHNTVDYSDQLDLSQTKGNVIANEGINITELVAYKEFRFVDPLDANGLVPPGFEGLQGRGAAASGYEDTPSSWKEI